MKTILTRIVAAVISAVLCILLCSCSEVNETIPAGPATASPQTEAESPFPITISSVTLEKAPETVASLSPAVTEIICELGFKDKLSGKSCYCDYPADISALSEIGSAANPDINAILTLKPELVVTQSPIAKKDITALNDAGTAVLILSAPDSMDEMEDLYRSIYEIFCGVTEAEDAVIDAVFEPIYSKLANENGTVKSFVCILSSGLAVASNSTFQGSFLSYFGRNCAAETDSFAISAEEIKEMNPEYIIIPETLKLKKLPEEINELDAVKSGRIIRLDADTKALFERPTSRISGAIDTIDKLIKESADN